MKNQLFKSVLVILVVALLGSAFAQGSRNQRAKKGKLFQQLNLTETQQKQLAEFKLDHQEYALDIRNKIAKNRLEIKKLMLDDNLNESRLLELSGINSDLRGKMHDSKLKMWLDAYKVLNKDQQKVWKKIMVAKKMKTAHNKKGLRRGSRCGNNRGMMKGEQPGNNR